MIIHLRDQEGLTWSEIAERLGSSKGAVNSSYRNALAKRNRKPKARASTVEIKKPKETAEALDLATDPFATISRAAKECGFPQSTLNQLLKRMRTRYQPLNEAIRKVKCSEMIKLLDDRAYRALDYIDDYALAGAGVRDLAVTTGIMLDKARLLREQPTQIVTVEERRKLIELMPMFLKEAERRGMVIENGKVIIPEALEKPKEDLETDAKEGGDSHDDGEDAG